jgi:L-rhamnose mutarotase
MQRVCFTLQVKKYRVGDYLAAHQVWPEMLEAMRDAGIRNYSMYMAKDGTAVGYFESDDVQASLGRLGRTDVNRRWQEHMAEYFESSGDLQTNGAQWLEPYFLME